MFDKILSGILSPIFSIIDKAVLDKTKALELKSEIEQAVLANKAELIKTMGDIARAEIAGNLYQKSWRPTLAYMLIFLLAWTYFLVPILQSFGIVIDPPPEEAIKHISAIFFAVYGFGRSAEKIAPVVADKLFKGRAK